jgi:hypothetical protein
MIVAALSTPLNDRPADAETTDDDVGGLQSRELSPHAFHDTHVACTRIAERGECLSIGGAVVGGNGLFNTVELDCDGALCDALLIGLDGAAARKKAAAIADYGRSGKFGVAASAAGSEIER